MEGINELYNYFKDGYKAFISEAGNDFKYIKDNLPNYMKSFSNANENGKNLVFVSLIYTDKKIVPHITFSTEYLIIDYQFPGARNYNYNCLTVFVHFNADTFKEEVNKFKELLKQ